MKYDVNDVIFEESVERIVSFVFLHCFCLRILATNDLVLCEKMSSPPTVYTDYCIFFEWETMKNYDSSGRFFLSKPHLMRFCLSHEVFSAVEGDP